ncbi:MarR family transcriptional regulator [Quadrisphaera sp. INWT6]|uniref:MarR family winged helix-turn-helix transcriptional regulator n=1 Tax=Quadrisphaera sp. INWT6 TaxID=2596917 RepID=UPI00189265F6|nr:MarR family transcriptional regulator [Quadrisphaera sp. INWT6]MBF5081282.1 MarR family transcriptional regulator [Quadrisphaera sp. INWT6]
MDVPWLDRTQLAAWVRVAALLEVLPGTLDGQLRRDADVTLFEYFVLAMLSESPTRSLRMSELAAQTSATLPRLSHVVKRMESRGLVERRPDPDDRRATTCVLTDGGLARIEQAAPGHVAAVREHVVDVLTPEQITQLTGIADALLRSLDSSGGMAAMYRRYDDGAVSGAPGAATPPVRP